MIDTLITALSTELELSAEEIADTIWLALKIQESQSESATQKLKNDLSQPSLKNEELEGETLPETPTKTSDSGETASKQSPDEQKAGIYPRNQQETLFKSELSFKVPDAPSLREPLTLARALKPLMRRIPSGTTLVLDEAATTQRIANEGLWLPVLRPTLEPWLDLELVVDEGISMQIWRHTIRELERLLKNYGIFRDVRVWGLIADNLEQVQIRRGIGATAKNQSPRSPAELIDPSGRRLVLVVSDCVSSLWRDGKVTTTLEIWAKQGSMAIVQMLPKWLWKRTALGRASEVRLQGLNPGDFNQKLIAKEVSLWDELEETRGVKVPVFTLEPDKVATWAQMLSGKGGIWTSGYVFKLDPIPVNQGRDLFNLNYGQQSAEQRVQAFRVTASPMARKLAGLLAAAPVISLPIVRLIQRTLLKESQQVHVAEVFLGGLLKPLSEINAETNPDYVQYEFMDGVRQLLVDSVPSGYVLNVVDEVSKDVAKNLGLSLEDFAAVLRNPQQVRDSEIAGDVGYFATVTAQVLRRLGGEYARFANSLENNIANEKEIAKLVRVLEITQHEFTRRSVAESLGKIAVGNEIAITTLITILKITKDEKTRWIVADTLKKIAVGNEIAITALIEIIENTVYANILRIATKILEVIAVGNERAISTLLTLLETNNKFVRERVVEILQVIAVGNEEARQALIRAIQKPSTVLSQFQSLIQDKTEGFVGRKYVFDAIETFIQENKKGYFTIIGDPGQGKSAILAKYVQDTECIAHFNVQLQGANRADQFLESVCKQLITRYQLPYDPLPSNTTLDGEFLGHLLDEVAQRRNGQPVIIAVDALDEVDSGSYRDANILYLPPHLPDGVYFIMTRRRGVEVPLTTYAPNQIINLLDYQIDSQRDVRLYIQNRVDGSENLSQQIDERQEKISIFADKIADKSENNFMYLRYLLLDIENGLYKDLSLERFPQGLQGYYDFHWRRMGMTANLLPDAKIKILYILGEVKQPVSRQQICDFSGEDTLTVQIVLNEWQPFLHIVIRNGVKFYRIYNNSFRDFLHRKDILDQTRLTIPEVHLLIAKEQLKK
ncbi:SAV_2336 N-terminal domain-related protein [Tychonema sp. BBK16]|uniref:SAV_2336 N-terminal domain-related protein n=1 Tax=Tychonema sp. BBK16 TaxID=2699888 RepID=UPI0038D32F15